MALLAGSSVQHVSTALLQRACSLQQLRHHYSPSALRQPATSRPALNLPEEGPSTSGRSSQAASTSAAKQAALGLFEGLLQRSRNGGLASSSAAPHVRERQQGSSLSVAASAAMAEHLATSQSTSTRQVRGFHMKEAPSEVKMESQLIFESAWRRFQERHGTNFRVPREVVWLNGAPGSGKGVSTPHILRARNMSRSVCMSSILASTPEARKFIDAGEMISDALVADVLLETLLTASSGEGAEYGLVIDGFPRTACQVDVLKLLYERLQELHGRYADTPLAARFPRPNFKVVVLYVDEDTSVRRQLARALAASAHNKRVMDAGGGQLHEERSTDVSADKASKRYQIFRSHYSATLRLKQFFPFHLIDAMGSLHETQEQISQELRYQSSLDLSEETYSAVRHLPLARELQRLARQQLVTRLETYNCGASKTAFRSIISLLETEALPLLRQGGLSGRAEWSSSDSIFSLNPDAVAMVVDILSDRGFLASYARDSVIVPVRFDTTTGRIESEARPLHRFTIRFEGTGEGQQQAALKAMEIAARMAEARSGTSSSGFAVSGCAGSSMSGSGSSGFATAEAALIAERAAKHSTSSGSSNGSSQASHSPVTMSFLPQHLLEREARLCAQQLQQEQLQREQDAWDDAADASEAVACGARA